MADPAHSREYHVNAHGQANLHLGDNIHYHNYAPLQNHVSSAAHSRGLCLGNAPVIPTDAFKGRTAELQQLKDWLIPCNHAQRQSVVSIVGMGGMGKTQLSLAFAQACAPEFSSVFWCAANDETNLRRGLAGLRSIMFPEYPTPGSTADDERLAVGHVQRWLSTQENDRWLLILDNYDDPQLPGVRSPTGFDIRKFFPARAHGSILITTRSTKLAFSQQLHLKSLQDNLVSVDILSHRSGHCLSIDDDGVLPLVTRLGGLPLALATAGTYMASTSLACGEYLNLYNSKWTELFGDEAEELFDYEDRTLSSTWNISLDCIRAQDPNIANLFLFLAFFNPIHIPTVYITQAVQSEPHNDTPWLTHLTQTDIRFQRAMAKLHSYSLVDSVADIYQVHPCLHDWLIEIQSPNSNSTLFLTAIRIINNQEYATFSERMNSKSPMEALVHHAQHLMNPCFRQFWQAYATNEEIREAMHNLCAMSSFLESCQYLKPTLLFLLEFCEAQMGKDSYITATANLSLGRFYDNLERYEEAQDCYKRAIAIFEDCCGKDENITIDAMGKLAQAYDRQGSRDEAVATQEEVLVRSERCHGLDHASTLGAVILLAKFYQKVDQHEEAQAMYERARIGYENSSNGDESFSDDIMFDMMEIYQEQGNLDAAERLGRSALAKSEREMGRLHLGTMAITLNLSRITWAKGNLEETERLTKLALSTIESSIGLDWWIMFRIALDLGVVYEKQNKLSESEETYMYALIGLEKTRGHDNDWTIEAVRHLENLYRENGALEAVNEVFERARTKRMVFERASTSPHQVQPAPTP